MSYQHALLRIKESGRKETFPLCTPYREKKGKETTPSFLGKLSAPRARTREGLTKSRRYRLAGAAASEIIETCFGSPDDHALWAKVIYDYPEALETILDKARELSSRWRQNELRNPVTAFQKWLGKNFPKKVAASFGS